MNMKKLEKVVLLCVLLMGIIAGISYGLWHRTLEQKGVNTIIAGCFQMELEGGNSINLEKASPITDSRGLTLVPYTFTIKNTCTNGAKYAINLETLTDSTMDNNFVKVSIGDKLDVLENFEKVDDLQVGTKGYELITGELDGASSEGADDGESVTYNLRVWMDYDATNSQISKVFRGQIVVSSSPKKVRKVLATADISETESDNVFLNYYNDGSIVFSGNGDMVQLDGGLISNLLNLVVTNNEKLQDISTQSTNLSQTSQTVLGIVAQLSFGGYKYSSVMTDGTIDFSHVTNNTELYNEIEAFVNGSGFVPADEIEFVLNASKIITTEIKQIKSIKIQEGITSISSYLFDSVVVDSTLKMPSTMKEINRAAFQNSSIQVLLNEGLETIDDDAFNNSEITAINLPSTLKSIGYYAFTNSLITNVTIPKNVVVAGFAFTDCSELTSVVWNSEASKFIGGQMFKNNPKLTSVVIGKNITSIGADSFDNKTVNPNLVLKFRTTEENKTNIIETISGEMFDFTNYNVEWGYTE